MQRAGGEQEYLEYARWLLDHPRIESTERMYAEFDKQFPHAPDEARHIAFAKAARMPSERDRAKVAAALPTGYEDMSLADFIDAGGLHDAMCDQRPCGLPRQECLQSACGTDYPCLERAMELSQLECRR